MDKKFFLNWLAIFLAWFFGDFLVHAVLLYGDYAKLPNLFRTEADSQQYFHFMLLAHIMMSGAMVWIYRNGMCAKPWAGQGFRFGLAVVTLNTAPLYLIYYSVQPMPGALIAKQILFEGSLVILLGVLTAFLHRGQQKG